MTLRSYRQEVSSPCDPHEAWCGTTHIGCEHPGNRIPRDRLAKQRLDRRVDLRDPHRCPMVGEHPNDGILNPAGSPSPTSSGRDRPWWRIAGTQPSQLLGETIQAGSGFLVRQDRQNLRHERVNRGRILVRIASARLHFWTGRVSLIELRTRRLPFGSVECGPSPQAKAAGAGRERIRADLPHGVGW